MQRGSAAWNDGLNVNDELIAINDYRITGAADTKGVSDLVNTISSKKIGEKIKATISRDGIIKILDITIAKAIGGKYRIEIDKSATDEQLAIRKIWLSL